MKLSPWSSVALIAFAQPGCRCAGETHASATATPSATAPHTEEAAAPIAIADVVLGTSHGCALTQTGEVRCWGTNLTGELGADVDSASSPVTVAGLGTVVEVAAGGSSTCARLNDGTVSCWGLDGGRAGRPQQEHTSPDPELLDLYRTRAFTPRPVLGLFAVARLVLGPRGAGCALLRDASARCWGPNAAGQLGDGTKVSRSNAAPVRGIADAVDIGVGVDFACARLRDGKVKCWGDTGWFTGEEPSPIPVRMPSLEMPGRLVIGAHHACVLRDDASVACFGAHLGQPCALGAREPPFVPAVAGVVQLALGPDHACALLRGGTVTCWGKRNLVGGQVGEDCAEPTRVPELDGVVRIAAGESSTCALRQSGELMCWGATLGAPNTNWRLGPKPTRLAGLE